MAFTHRRSRQEDTSLLKQRVLSAVPAVIATAAFVCSYAGNFFCNNIQFAPSGNFDSSDPYRPRTITYGLWMYKEFRVSNQYNGEVYFSEYCAGYEEGTEFDTAWKIARAFAVLTMIAAGFLLLWQCFAPFLLFDALYWRWAMVLFALLGACQGLTLLFVTSSACFDNVLLEEMVANPDIYPSTCSWDWGTLVGFSSTFLYFATAASFCAIPAPGVRPNERKFPMMVWDTAEENDDNDEGSFASHDEFDDDSIESFACEYEEDHDRKEANNYPTTITKNQSLEDMTETEFSQTGYEEDEEQELTVSEVKYFDRCTV